MTSGGDAGRGADRGPPMQDGVPTVLLVTSNWCVPDGSLCAGPEPGFVERFRAEVRRASLRGGVRADGSYRPVQGIAIVFAGDTFDWLTSREWTGDVRPWQAGRRAAAARERSAAGSLRLGGRLLATLLAWGRRGLVVPAADRRGRPLYGSVHRVTVRIALVRGDKDRWIDGLAPAGGMAGVWVGSRWSDGAVTVRHGEEIEPPWHAVGAEPTLGESLAVELVARFAAALPEAAGREPRTGAAVRRIVMGRLADAPARLAGWLEERGRAGTLSAVAREAIVGEWNRAVSCWHRAARRLGLACVGGIDVVDDVAAAMTLAADADATPPSVHERRPPFPVATRPTAGKTAVFGGRRSPHRATIDVFHGLPAAVEGEQRGADHTGPGWSETTSCEILGHPPAGYSPPSSRRGRLLCIGPEPLSIVAPDGGPGGDSLPTGLALFDPPGMIPRGTAAGGPPVPSAAVVGTGPAGPWLDWLPVVGGAPAQLGRHDACGALGIWRSQPASFGRSIVDAA